MTIHHDIALALATTLAACCLIAWMFGKPQSNYDILKDIVGFATIIATNTFAHAQSVRSGTAAANKKNDQSPGDGTR